MTCSNSTCLAFFGHLSFRLSPLGVDLVSIIYIMCVCAYVRVFVASDFILNTLRYVYLTEHLVHVVAITLIQSVD